MFTGTKSYTLNGQGDWEGKREGTSKHDDSAAAVMPLMIITGLPFIRLMISLVLARSLWQR